MNIPPLRERREDIPLLAAAPPETRSPRTARRGSIPRPLEVLQRHDWPGNVRELLHVLAAGVPGRRRRITGELLLAELAGRGRSARGRPAAPFHDTIDKTERELLDSALQAAGGNKSAAAAALGMKLSTFRDKLVKHGLG